MSGSLTFAISLSGVSLDSFSTTALAAALEQAAGVSAGAVTVSVVNFELTTTLSLTGSVTSVTDIQRAAIVSSLAASLSVSAAQVQLALVPSAHRRSLLLQSVQLRVTVMGLGSDAASVKRTGEQLTASSTLSAVVARVASPEVTGASATPVSVTSQVEVKVSVPATMSPAAVAATFSSGNAASLGAQLQAAGVPFSSIAINSDAPAVLPPPPPPTTATPEAVKPNNNIAIAISISVFFVMLVCGASCYWSRRMRGARKVVAHKWVGKTFVKDEEEYEDAYDTPSPLPPPPARTRIPALQIPAFDGAARRNMVMEQSGGRSTNSASTYVMSAIAEVEAPAPEQNLRPLSTMARTRTPALMVPSADVSIRRDAILDVGEPSSLASPAAAAAHQQWRLEQPVRPHDAGGSARGRRPALLVPVEDAAPRRAAFLNAAGPSAPNVVSQQATYPPAPYDAAARSRHHALLQAFAPPSAREDVALNLSGVAEVEEEDDEVSAFLPSPSYHGTP
jgi:hypothetical protein